MTELLLDAAGRRRSPTTMPGFQRRPPPRTKASAIPPTAEEIVAVMRAAGHSAHGHRLRAPIVVLWCTGLRIHQALALSEGDLDHRRGSLLVRRGKGGGLREVGMDERAWEHLRRWAALRLKLPVGPPRWRHDRPDLRATAVECGRAERSAPHGRGRRRAPTLRPASAATRARRRDGP